MTRNTAPIPLRKYVESEGLLAKWRLNGDETQWARGHKLNGHLTEVMSACDFLFTEPYHSHASFGRGLYEVMHLARFVTFPDFRHWCELAALGHDLGKASGEFQMMLWGIEHSYRKHIALKQDQDTIRTEMGFEKRHKQAYRHEFMSAILLWQHPEIRAWFRAEAGSDQGFEYVLAGVFGHHLKADFGKAIRSDVFIGYTPLPVFLKKMSHDLAILVKQRGLTPFPVVGDYDASHPLLASETSLKDVLKSMVDGFGRRDDDDPVSGAIKWMVILSDTFGSISQEPKESLAHARERIYSNLRQMFAPARSGAGHDYRRRVISRLFASPSELEEVGTNARAGVGGLTPEDQEELFEGVLRPLQKQCYLPNGEDLIVTASTGGGKTVASMVWALPHLQVIYTTPTTDTATRLYFDYADAAEDAIRHSRAWMDMPRLTSTPESDTGENQEEQADADEVMLTLRGFEDFNAGITFTTVDQVLGMMAFYRKSVMWLLYVVSAQVVFDEFHAYDETMRAWYFRFLEWFPGIRTAHMSATVPDPLRIRLEDTLRVTGKKVVRVCDPAGTGLARSAPRFRIHLIDEQEAPSHFLPGSLWIINTVLRCQQAGKQFKDAIVYHSRFRYTDRREIRDDVVEAFRKRTGDSVVATQVAEMSLDISALQMLMECCPPASLIQRLGRVNREEHPKTVANVYVYLPTMEHGLPYSMKGDPADFLADYERWMQFIRGLTGRDISQDDLETAFQSFYLDPLNLDRDKVVYTNRLRTFRRNIRHGSVTVQCLLKSDLDADPTMKTGKVKWMSVPAILGSVDRRTIKGGIGVYEHHFILDDRGSEWRYDTRLGLIDKKKF